MYHTIMIQMKVRKNNLVNNIKFYDTCSLLLGLDDIFNEPFVISSITLEELEHIKTSAHKDIH